MTTAIRNIKSNLGKMLVVIFLCLFGCTTSDLISTDYKLRLFTFVERPDVSIGTLEVKKINPSQDNSTWGTLCSSGSVEWTLSRANWACGILGYKWGEVYTGQKPRRVMSRSWSEVIDWSCSKKPETDSTVTCLSPPTVSMSSYCSSVVYLSCGALEAKFDSLSLDPSLSQGFLSMLHTFRMTPVCGAGWSARESKAFCKALGFSNGTAIGGIVSDTRASTASVENVNCPTEDTRPSLCSSVRQPYGCYYSSRVYLSCINGTILDENEEIYLPKLSNKPYGSVTVQVNNVTAKLCAETYLTDNDAAVICHSWGYIGGVILGENTNKPASIKMLGTDDDLIMMRTPVCNGTEKTLTECPRWHTPQFGSASARCVGNIGLNVLCYNQGYTITVADDGIVRVTYDGISGVILDDALWDDADAAVICKSLGHDGGSIRNDSIVTTPVNTTIYLRGLACKGNEKQIFQCPNQGFSSQAATNRSRPARVTCHNKVFLKNMDGIKQAGIVYMYTGSQWQPLCASTFRESATKSVCRTLGYEKGIPLGTNAYGHQGFSISKMIALYCGQNVTHLDNCTYYPNYCYRGQENYASVLCYNGDKYANISDMKVSLDATDKFQGNQNVAGVVTLRINDFPTHICDMGWNDKAATIACKMIGHQGGVAYRFSNYIHHPYSMNNINCTGRETSLHDCQYNMGTTTRCLQPAGALCYNQSLELTIQESPGELSVPVISYDGQQGYICADGWSNNDAGVFCRQMGYADGKASRMRSSIGETFFMNDLRCHGREENIFQCANDGWKQVGYCANKAIIKCDRFVRVKPFTYGSNSTTGTVEVFMQNRWGDVCGSGFDAKAASVVCREMGYMNSRVLPSDRFPISYSSPKWVNHVSCNGTEDTLLSCDYTSRNVCTYYDSNIASVYCTNSTISDEMTVRLVGGTSMNTGRVVLSKYGYDGKICPYSWDTAAAKVTCKMLGYTNGEALRHSVYSTNNYWMVNYNCSENYTHLSQCITKKVNGSTACYARQQVAALCHNGTDLQYRLSGGGQKYGRIEILYNGVWGAVCNNDKRWSDVEANTVCKQLGFFGGTVFRGSLKPPNRTMPFYLSGVDCGIRDTSLLECPSNGWSPRVSQCNNNSAAVSCYGKVRFYPRYGSDGSGPLEVIHENSWGMICDDNFGNNEAKVVCRELGYADGIPVCCSAFGYMSRTFKMSNVVCTGNEISLDECQKTMASYLRCRNNLYASVKCFNRPPQPEEVEVKLNGSASSNTGVVQFKYLGLWGFICGDAWTDREAKVLCTQMGYNGTGIAYKHLVRDKTVPYWSRKIECNGTEKTLLDCQYEPLTSTQTCTYAGMAAGVMCAKDIQINLANGTSNAGRVEISVDGEWGTVCGNTWGVDETNVVCRNLGYTMGERHSYGSGRGKVWLHDVQCQGNESRIFDCAFNGWNLVVPPSRSPYMRTCTHTFDVGVYCYKEVLLKGVYGKVVNNNLGTLQMEVNKNWYHFCYDENFDDHAATIVCKQLGYVDGHHLCCYSPPRYSTLLSTNSLAISGIKCDDSKTKLNDCAYNLTTCPSKQFVNIYCSNTTIDGPDNKEIKVKINPSQGLSYSGPLSVIWRGIEGRICPKEWDDKDANVACKMLGYKGGVALQEYSFRRDLPHLVGNMSCTGKETSLNQCKFSQAGTQMGCTFNDYSAGVLCYNRTGVQYRISGGTSTYGRPEIFYEGRWGSICGVGGSVFCRNLGFVDGIAVTKINDTRNRPPFVIGPLSCLGIEDTPLMCPNYGWGNTYSYSCMHYYYGTRWVQCYNEVRLNSNENEIKPYGLVEVYRNESWMLVCDDGSFDQNAANVVCRQLGYESGIPLCCSPFQVYGFRYSVGRVKCTGTETSFTQCQFQFGRCSTSKYMGVTCYNGTVGGVEYSIQGVNEYTGKVKVTYVGVKGHICKDGWDDVDADIFCRGQGFVGGQAYYHYSSMYEASVPFWTSEVDCAENSTSFENCNHVGFGNVEKCSSRDPAGVLCYRSSGTEYRIGGKGAGDNHGLIQVKIGLESWGTICNRIWTLEDANVACRMFGFGYGEPVYYSNYTEDTNNYYRNSLHCYGIEENLDDCPQTGWYSSSTYCSYSTKPAVKCSTGNYKLSFYGASANSGKLMVTVGGSQSGTICADGWGMREAQVACKTLGYPYGYPYPHRDGEYDPVVDYLFGQVNCTGNETSLFDCEFSDNSTGNMENCSSQHSAGALCLKSYSDIKYRLAGGDKHHGRVEIGVEDIWGTVCSADFDDNAAAVVCNRLGFHGGQAIDFKVYGPGTGPIFLGYLNCTGTEESLHYCPHGGWRRSNTRLTIERKEIRGRIPRSDYVVKFCSNHVYDAGVYCYENVRLNTGAESQFGAVQIYDSQKWKTVCRDSWNDSAAEKTCNELGYQFGVPIEAPAPKSRPKHVKHPYSFYNPNIQPPPEEDTKFELQFNGCPSNEEAISNCSFSPIPVPQGCSSQSAALVQCFNSTTYFNIPDYTIRLARDDSASDYHGVVEMIEGGTWGRTCADGFGKAEADVVCRNLGFAGGAPYLHIFVHQTPMLFKSIKCNGTERNVSECTIMSSGAGTEMCESEDHDAGVICYKQQGLKYSIEGSSDKGLVKIEYDGKEGYVCRNSWNPVNAGVFCRQFGYADGMNLNMNRTLNMTSFPLMWVMNIQCEGNEDSILQCPNTGWNESSFSYSCIGAGVQCYNTVNEITQVHLTGINSYMGRVELMVQPANQWGTICENGFDDQDAQVICRMLGLEGGKAMSLVLTITRRLGNFSNIDGPVWLSGLGCLGNESSIADCKHDGLGYSDCYHYQDVVVACSPPKTTTLLPSTSSTTPSTKTFTGSSSTTTSQTMTPTSTTTTTTTTTATPVTRSSISSTTSSSTTTSSTTASTVFSTTSSKKTTPKKSTPTTTAQNPTGKITKTTTSGNGIGDKKGSTQHEKKVSLPAVIIPIAILLLIILALVIIVCRRRAKRGRGGDIIGYGDDENSEDESYAPNTTQFSNKLYDYKYGGEEEDEDHSEPFKTSPGVSYATVFKDDVIDTNQNSSVL